MDDFIFVKSEDLRNLIREEIAKLGSKSAVDKPAERPITTKELCKFLGITEPTVIRWRKKGKIPFLQVGSAIRFNLTEVIAALSNKQKNKF